MDCDAGHNKNNALTDITTISEKIDYEKYIALHCDLVRSYGKQVFSFLL